MNIHTNTIEKPKFKNNLSNSDLLLGLPIPPIKRLEIISSNDFEDLIREWATEYLENKYTEVARCGGAGDMGRDVIGYLPTKPGEKIRWVNYQCKHYSFSLKPTDIYLELAKLCYYTFKESYTMPDEYYFVSPLGVGSKLRTMIDEPSKLKENLISNWDTYCKDHITKTIQVDLSGDLYDYVKKIDLSIVKSIDPQTLIHQHSKTRYFFYRFGGIHKTRPIPLEAPVNIKSNENLYVTKLLAAYSDHYKSNISTVDALKDLKKYYNHFSRQRSTFYSAESLMRFERDTLPSDVDAFRVLKIEVFDGIIDTVESNFIDGYERVKKVCEIARSLNTPSYPLYTSIKGNDLVGLCHHLANEDLIDWVDV